MAESLQVRLIRCTAPAGKEGDDVSAFPSRRLLLYLFSASVNSFSKPFARSLTSNDGSSSTSRLIVETKLGCLLILEGSVAASKTVLMTFRRFKRTTAFG